MGSVAVIGSTAAVAIACEGKTLTALKKGIESDIKSQNSEASENREKMLADQPSEKENLEKEVKEAEKTVEEAKKGLRKANQDYQDALKKGKPYEAGDQVGKAPKDITDEIDKTGGELKKAIQKLEEAKEKLEKLKPTNKELKSETPKEPKAKS
ncbi:lipoprotein, (VlcA) [Mycoplasma mycoides]|uniref:lipoprotein, (VlcA) n=1 Tax=Mycoplasma mycoides TaxID=2102 RepID=UPI0022408793|nr:lipoprotein, (VlcA) [Mycoplasma mycoides]